MMCILKNMRKLIVIGGGAAGMMAAVQAAELGADVALLEKNEKLGKKLYITGKGRCNVTNQCDLQTFQRHVVRNPRFLFSALQLLSPTDLMEWFERHGCALIVERGNRVFPASQKASDITKALERALEQLGVHIFRNTQVLRLLIEDGTVKGVITNRGSMMADSVILATGGCSYPSTGSTGDGWKWLSEAGHQLNPARPSLTGLRSSERWVTDLQGVSLKNVTISVKRGKKEVFSELGEMLFTHFGISGPLVLSASAYLADCSFDDVTLALDLKPGMTREQLDVRIQRDIAQSPQKQLIHLLRGLFPQKVAETICYLCGFNGQERGCDFQRVQRMKLIDNTKALRIPVAGLCSMEEAIVTCGGLCVKEVNPSTMESKLVKNLFIAGELLDVDALTGGFNLQIAFATGFTAGTSAAKALQWE